MYNYIVFRVDSSSKIATGHVMRCLTLAKSLRKKKVEIVFICRALEGNIIDRIRKSDFKVIILPRPNKAIKSGAINQYLHWLEVDLSEDIRQTKEILLNLGKNIALIIDHYAIDKTWESEMRDFVNKIIVIDDLANRRHNSDILIDQNLYDNYQTRYDNLVPKNCQKFLGPQYAILREQFLFIKPRMRAAVKTILVCFGGIDPDNITLKAIKAIIMAQSHLKINFNIMVIGAKNNYQKQIRNICQENSFEYRSYVDNMAEVMNWADLTIGAGGSMSWERCCIKLPAIVISLAQNQIDICKALNDGGVIDYLGENADVSVDDIILKLVNAYKNFNYKNLDLSYKFNEIVDNIL